VLFENARMNLERLEKRLMKDEGYSRVAYLDTVGVWTIGFGSTRLFGQPVKEDDSVTEDVARIQLRADIYGAIIDAAQIFPRFNELDDVRQEVLINMSYNLGSHKLTQFKNLRSAVDALEFRRAAEEMVDSKWFTQVGGRGQRLVAAMKTGQWAISEDKVTI